MMRPLSLTALLFACASMHAGDWPRFRGPNGLAATDDPKVPIKWTAKNTLWSIPIPGVGISSPVVSGGKIYLTFAEDEGHKRTLWCLDAKSGKELWRNTKDFRTHKKHNKNSYATATPAVEDGIVVNIFGDTEKYLVSAFTEDGSPAWEHDLGGFKANHASGGSPIIHKGKVIATKEHDGESILVCYELKTGKELWRTPFNAPHASYTTPIVYATSEGETVVCSHSYFGFAGYDLKTGKRRWACPGFVRRTVGSPALVDGLIVGTCGEGNNGVVMLACNPSEASSEELKPTLEVKARIPYCPTPIGVGDKMYFVTDLGLFRCLNVRTGEQFFQQRLRGNHTASPIRVGDKIFIVGEDGTVTVVKVGEKYERVALNNLDDYFLATPAVADGRMYLRGEKKLWCIGNP